MKKVSLILGVAAVVVLTVRAQVTVQNIAMREGWNAVYVGVEPQMSADELFADWPVESVSLYNSAAFLSTETDKSEMTGETLAKVPFLVWRRDLPGLSSLKRVVADSVLVFFATNEFSQPLLPLVGEPRAPRIAWHPSDASGETLNYVGARVLGEVSPAAYFAGAKFSNFEVRSLFGLTESDPKCLPVATAKLSEDKSTAYLVAADKISDWSGPLWVEPANGLQFSDYLTDLTLSIRNDSLTTNNITFEYRASLSTAEGGDGVQPVAFKLLGENGWEDFTVNGSRTARVAPGCTWKVRLAVDRTVMTETGRQLGGILRVTDDSAIKPLVEVPLSVIESPGRTGRWPAGLWSGKARLTQVSKVQNGKVIDGVKAGGELEARLIVFVNADGKARLLQRVVVVDANTGDTTFSEAAIYAGTAKVAASAGKQVRLSSAFLPVDVPVIPAARGTFGREVAFDYRVAADSPSNPFRHKLHPQFDGLQADFKTPLPDGADFSQYLSTVKPELFSFDGHIELTFDTGTAAAWSPSEGLSGQISWRYSGLRQEGGITASGEFTINRISTSINYQE